MTGFVVIVTIVVALVLALGPVRDRYAPRPGADRRDDADWRRLQEELRTARRP